MSTQVKEHNRQDKEITMTEKPSPALETALAYHRAWTGHDFERAMTYVAEDIVCEAPSGRIEGAAAFREFMGPFTRILTGSSLIAAFGDEETALLMYGTETVPVASAPGAECLTVRDGRITHLRIIFDRAPFAAAREEATES
ncbi:nuclear transport factor 2 family protein [Amycolatopsis cihanbeyliensis]|nr:nuclear transport factor 2 family protein [Amycolatopsis cihanbeyliensis]